MKTCWNVFGIWGGEKYVRNIIAKACKRGDQPTPLCHCIIIATMHTLVLPVLLLHSSLAFCIADLSGSRIASSFSSLGSVPCALCPALCPVL
jgi:hypothetical protein